VRVAPYDRRLTLCRRCLATTFTNSYAAFGVSPLRELAQAFWRDILNLPVGHRRQAGEDIAEVSVGFDTVTAAALNDRVDDRAAFSSVGVAEEEPGSRFEAIMFSVRYILGRVCRSCLMDNAPRWR
jgi:hypothetical protein